MSTLRRDDHSTAIAYLAQLERDVERKATAPTSGWASMSLSQPMAWSDGGISPAPGDGPLHLNVVVMACLGWLDRNFPTSDLRVCKVAGNDELGDAIPNHPFMELMDQPNRRDTFHSFLQSYLLSDVVDGNTFLVKVRPNSQKGIHSLWWVPPWTVTVIPSRSRDADAPIEKFRVMVGGATQEYDPSEVIHIKDGIDPFNPTRGLSKLKAGLRSASTIDRAEAYTQALMRNCGAIPIMLSPSSEGEQIEPSNIPILREQFVEDQAGFGSGRPLFFPQGLRAEKLSVSPEEMALDKIRDFSLAALCALIGTPAMAVGLPDPGKTYSNLAQAEYMAWRNGLIPRQDRFAEAIDIQCPELVDRTRERVVWDRSRVAVLQLPKLERLDGLTKAAGGPILTPDEARKFLDMNELPDGAGATLAVQGGVKPVVSVDTQAGQQTIAADVQATALNGAQVISLVEIANAVAVGSLPADSARALIAASFPNLTAEQVAAIVGPLVAFEPAPPPTLTVRPAAQPSLPSPDAQKSAHREREDGTRPFGEPIEVKDDMPPKVGSGNADEQGDGNGGGDYDLPTGKPIRDELVAWFKQQLAAVLGTIPPDMADIPESFPVLADYNDPMSRAMTPILATYWQESGSREIGKLKAATGLDLDEWTVVNPKTQEKIQSAAFAFCEATNKTTSLELTTAMSRLRDELVQGVVNEGDTLVQLRKRVQAVFENAEEWRAQRIAATEASRAVHAAQEAADIESGVVVGLEWLLSADACPLCQAVNDKVKRVKLGQRFAEVGTNATYKDVRFPPIHPGCQCSVTSVLSPEYGGPESPEWGETLIQPKIEPSSEESSEA